MVPTLFSILRYIQTIHGRPVIEVDTQHAPRLSAPLPSFAPTHTIIHAYNCDDGTLQRLVFETVYLLSKIIQNDSFGRCIVTWPDHATTLMAYSNFACPNVTSIVHSLLEQLVTELQSLHKETAEQQERARQRQLWRRIQDTLAEMNTGDNPAWPAHLIMDGNDEQQGDEGPEKMMSPEMIPYLSIKVCANSGCWMKEMRTRQFASCRKCRKVWYCSPGCARQNAKQHQTCHEPRA
jgi:hypothetical protein